MSHSPERIDKNCLNCGTTVAGRYCQNCGQENIQTRESFASLVKHFVFDVLHFDGKFFHTLGYLFIKPGFVARQYAEGKRASFLHPIRMYLFASAFFFLIFFTFQSPKANFTDSPAQLTPAQKAKDAASFPSKKGGDPSDTVYDKRIASLLDTAGVPGLRLDSLTGEEDSDRTAITFNNHQYGSAAEYDSTQASLPAAEKDGWFARRITLQGLKVNKKFKGAEGKREFFEALLHKLPYVLFVSLPFFAGLLKLLYVRRKNFYYSDHAVFTLFHYVFTFVLLLLVFGLIGLGNWSGWRIFSWLAILSGIYWPVHLYLGMKRFYLQGGGKTFAKFTALNVLGVFMIFIVFVLFFFLSIFQV